MVPEEHHRLEGIDSDIGRLKACVAWQEKVIANRELAILALDELIRDMLSCKEKPCEPCQVRAESCLKLYGDPDYAEQIASKLKESSDGK